MAADNSIKQSGFPQEIDRYAFSHWLSGFVAGEGHFALAIDLDKRKSFKCPYARFCIRLRHDDKPVLQLIRDFFRCGSLHFIAHVNNMPNAHPQWNYDVRRVADLYNIILPHFYSFPLRAKKSNDFEIWKEGVSLLWTVHKRKKQQRGQRGGFLPRWRTEEVISFQEYVDSLRSIRQPTTTTLLNTNEAGFLF